ncbi:N-acetyl sugar amidotransferase [Nitrosarchaeum sp.]|uniref:N-acetyl sugar amidotransferase n=1 Tax=Nitrosarchaeum sp. TaxID=2026886 RepID=UPI00247D3DA0|nr:N-acetyl sugar amidotransferase [Nitrosarchaeum sp.]MCV0411911.1 N-acetyl sugar amidotransferase [Nitrosarchaeum sp.]
MIRYCKNCVYPETKPDLKLDESGVCNACNFLEVKNKINWDERKQELRQILEKYRNKDGSNYDCIIPVSGGKDSHYQTYVIKKEFGLNPLLVAFRPREWTELGRKNLENLKKKLDVDCIEFTPKQDIYKKMQKIGLLDFGDASWPEHFGIFTVPFQVAVNYKIKLLIWGENSQAEYGGPLEDSLNPFLDEKWREKYGTKIETNDKTSGYREPEHMLRYGIDKKDLLPYKFPDKDEIKKLGIVGVFLGHYIKWDARNQLEIIKKIGFQVNEKPCEGTYTNFENLDNKGQGLHDYLKWIKFGYGRATDNASIDIRHGRITRKEGMELVKKFEGKIPELYLDEYLTDFELSRKDFMEVIDKFANYDLFKKDTNGKLLRDDKGNLTKINYDN